MRGELLRDREEGDSRLVEIGAKGTLIYLVIIFTFIPVATYLGWMSWKALTLNEIGDFLAGVFGPLSIIWLVLGFFQQGKELRLQVRELSLSVEQQAELVRVTRDALLHEREVLGLENERRSREQIPDLALSLVSEGASSAMSLGGSWRTLQLQNVGGTAYGNQIEVISVSPTLSNEKKRDHFEVGHLITVRCTDSEGTGWHFEASCADSFTAETHIKMDRSRAN